MEPRRRGGGVLVTTRICNRMSRKTISTSPVALFFHGRRDSVRSPTHLRGGSDGLADAIPSSSFMTKTLMVETNKAQLSMHIGL